MAHRAPCVQPHGALRAPAARAACSAIRPDVRSGVSLRSGPPDRLRQHLPVAQAAVGGRRSAGQGAVDSITVDEEGEYWPWRFGSTIHHVVKGPVDGTPLLLVPGFGVGAFHFSRNIDQLAAEGYRVFALDILGQGRSWPAAAPGSEEAAREDAPPLVYSTDTWTQMLADFCRDVIGGPAYIGGNSLGGFLAVQLAYEHPELCRGLLLLNATPFWSFLPREEQRSRGLKWLLGKVWDGAVPAPRWIRGLIERFWWNNLKRPETIRSMLSLVYADQDAASCPVMIDGIVAPTERPGAVDAFASIAFAPKTRRPFHEMVAALRCPVLLLYGRDDPWVVPLWGQRAKRVLDARDGSVPPADYLELSPAGHCPHHEVPDAVNAAAAAWLARQEAAAGRCSAERAAAADALGVLALGAGESVTVGGVGIYRTDGSPRNPFEHFDALLAKVRGTPV
ncbi:unnamed protein product [Pedinophyceae sp. YPF-701]|nr:unnamed protein product [Pedinophyceae sp. YPF-701]